MPNLALKRTPPVRATYGELEESRQSELET